MPSVDERIVEMRFDNKEFESGASESLGTIQKLKEALKFDGASQGLSEIEKAAKSFDLSAIANGVETIASKFSFLGILSTQVLSNIASSVISVGKKIATAIPNQIMTGGWTRATNIEQAKFQLAGLGVAWDDIKGNINAAVDGAAYGMDEAAKVAAQLVASGIEYGDVNSAMAHALRGVSGVAAMTNSTYEDIGHIFTTIAGNGRVMGNELTMIASRGLNAAATLVDFMNGVNDGSITATDSVTNAVKQITGGAVLTEQSLRELVSKGKINFEIFSEAMDNAFGEHATKANETFSGAFSNMKAALSRIGADYATPILNLGRDTFNALRNAFNSVRSFTQPFGEHGFTELLEKVSKWATLKIESWDFSWLEGIVTSVSNGLNAIWNLIQGLSNVLGVVKNVWKSIFPDSLVDRIVTFSEAALNLSESFLELTGGGNWTSFFKVPGMEQAVDDTTDSVEELGESYEDLESIVDRVLAGEFGNGDDRIKALTEAGYDWAKVQDAVNARFGITSHLAGEQADTIEEATESATDYASEITELARGTTWGKKAESLGYLEKFENILRGVFSVVSLIKNAITALWNASVVPFINSVSPVFGIIVSTIELFANLATAINNASTKTGLFSSIFGGLSTFMSGVGSRIVSIAAWIYQQIAGIINFLLQPENLTSIQKIFGGVGAVFSLLGKIIFAVSDAIGSVISHFLTFDDGEKTFIGSLLSSLGSFGDWLVGLNDAAEESDFFGTTMQAIAGFVIDAIEAIIVAFNWFKSVFTSILDKTKPLFTTIKTAASDFWEAIKPLFSSIGTAFSNLFSSADDEGNKTFEFSGLRSFVEWLTGIINFESVSSVLVSIIQLFTTLVTTVLGAISDLATNGNGNGLTKLLSGLFTLSVSDLIVSIASGLASFSSIVGTVKDVISSLTSDVDTPTLWDIAKSIGVMAAALFVLGNMPVDDIYRGVGAIAALTAVLMAAFAIFNKVTGSSSPATGKKNPITGFFDMLSSKVAGKMAQGDASSSLLNIAISVLVLAAALRVLATLDGTSLAKGIAAITVIIAELVGTFAILNKIDRINKASPGKKKSNVLSGILPLVISLLLISSVVKKLGKMSVGDLTKGIIAMTVILAELVAAFAIMNKINRKKKARGSGDTLKGIIPLAISLMLIGSVVKKLGSMGTGQIIQGIVALGLILTEIGAFLVIMRKLKVGRLNFADKMASSLLKISVALVVMSAAVKILGTMSLGEVGVALLALAGALVEIAIFSAFARRLGTTSRALIVLSTALLILAPAIRILGTMNLMEVGSALLAIAGTFAIFGISAYILRPVIGTILKLASTLMLLGSAMALAGAGLLLGTLALSIFGSMGSLAADTLLLALDTLVAGIGLLGQDLLNAIATIIIALCGALDQTIPVIVSTLGNVLTAVLFALVEYFPLVLNTIGLLVGELVMWLADLIGPLSDTIIKFVFILLNDIAIAIVNNGELLGSAIRNILLALGSLIWNGLKGLFQDLIKVLDYIFPGFSEKIEGTLGGMNEVIVEGITTDNQEMRDAVAENVQTIEDSYQEAVDDMDLPGISPGEGEDEEFSESGSDAADAFLTAFSDKMGADYDPTQWLKDTGLNLDDMGQYSPEQIMSMFDFSDTGLGEESEALVNEAAAHVENPEAYQTSMGTNVDGLVAGLKDGSTDVGDVIESLRSEWAGMMGSDGEYGLAGEGNMDEYIQSVYDQNPEMAAYMEENGIDLAEAMENPEAYGASAEENSQAYMDAQKVLGDFLTGSSADMIAQAATGLMSPEEFQKSAQSNINSYIQAQTQNAEAVTASTSQLATNAAQGFDKQNEFSNAGARLVMSIASGMSSMSSRVGQVASSIANSARGSMSKVLNGYNIGTNFVLGFNNGMIAKAPEVYETARIIADNVSKTMKQALDEHSPSRVTYGIGRYASEGLANGIRDYGFAVERSAENVSDVAIGQMKDAVQTVSDIINGIIDLDPTIRPVLDLSNIQNGALAVNSILGNTNAQLGLNSIMANTASINGAFKAQELAASQTNSQSLITTIRGIRSDINSLGERISQMQLVLDSGTLVGEIINPIDQELGRRQLYAERGV